MFGLSTKEVLISAIKNACVNSLPQYRSEMASLLKKSEDDDSSKIDNEINAISVNYLDAVCDSISQSYRTSSPKIFARFQLAISSPDMTGLPEEYDLDYFCDKGVPAGCVFGIAYFAITNKTVDSTKMFRIMSMLNHFQSDLMMQCLKELDSNM